MASSLTASRFFARLQSTADRLAAAIVAESARLGLPANHVDALAVLVECGDDGCSQTELARRLEMAESSLCGLVDRMQADGWLYRFRSKQDRRKSVLISTADGRTRYQSVRESRTALIAGWFANATDEQLSAIGLWVEALGRGNSTVPAGIALLLDENTDRHVVTPAWKEAG